MFSALRLAWRKLRREPGFFGFTSLTLGLVTGSCVAMASVLLLILHAALPVPQPDRMVALDERNAQDRAMSFSIPNALDVRAAGIFASVSSASCGRDSVRRGETTLPVQLCQVSPDFLTTFAVQPWLGRALDMREQAELASPVVYVSARLWERMQGSPEQLGTLSAAWFGNALPVVGVLPSGFDLPGEVDAWFVQRLDPADGGRTGHGLSLFARLRDGQSIEAAQAALSALATQLKQQHGEGTDASDFRITALDRHLYGGFARPLWLLMGGVLLLWLIGCANVGAMLAARAAERGRATATRLALGATRAALRREAWSELLLIGGFATVIAVGVGQALLWLVLHTHAGALPRAQLLATGQVDLLLLTALTALTLLLCAACTRLLAAPITAADLRAAGGRGQTASRARVGGRAALVVAQLALSVVLLSGAALLVRGLLKLQAVPSGFSERGQWIVEVAQPFPQDLWKRSGDAAYVRPHAQSHERIRAALAALPGVRAVGGSNALPLTDTGSNGGFWLQPDMTRPIDGYAEQAVITTEWTEAMGVQLLSGRPFALRDDYAAPHVALISASAREAFFKGRDPLGVEIQWGNMDGDPRMITIVGVVSDLRAAGLDKPPSPLIYLNASQRPAKTASMAFVVDPEPGFVPTAASLRGAVLGVAPEAAIHLRPLRELRGLALAPQRFQMLLTSLFAGSAALLCCIGLYGLLAYLVRSRSNELGVRLALGAKQTRVAGMVVRDGLKLAVIGVSLGGLLAALALRSVQALVFEVSALDAGNLLLVAASLLLIVLLASILPAWRASRIAPARVLGS